MGTLYEITKRKCVGEKHERKNEKMNTDNIRYENFSMKYVSEAAELAWKELEREKRNCPSLPEGNGKERLTQLLTWLSEQPYGKVALYQGKIIGFLAFGGPWDGFHGNEKGVFSPLGGSAFAEAKETGKGGISRGKLASMLFAEVAEELVRDGIFSCAISRYAHDEEVANSFIFNGFGIRCSDAIRAISEEKFGKNDKLGKTEKIDVQYEELKADAFKEIAQLRKKLVLHMGKAPIFFPTDLSRYEEWFHEEKRVFTAKVQGEIVGFISVEAEGENFLTEDEKMANICGAFFKEEFRGSGIAEGLLSYVFDIYRTEGVENMGVDFETLNPTALRFWSKYFTRYTYSFARRFDERIRGYAEYAQQANLENFDNY